MRWLLLCALLPACASTPDLVRALAQDEASVCLTVTGVYGRVQLARTRIADGEVRCTPDGGLVVRAGEGGQ